MTTAGSESRSTVVYFMIFFSGRFIQNSDINLQISYGYKRAATTQDNVDYKRLRCLQKLRGISNFADITLGLQILEFQTDYKY